MYHIRLPIDQDVQADNVEVEEHREVDCQADGVDAGRNYPGRYGVQAGVFVVLNHLKTLEHDHRVEDTAEEVACQQEGIPNLVDVERRHVVLGESAQVAPRLHVGQRVEQVDE